MNRSVVLLIVSLALLLGLALASLFIGAVSVSPLACLNWLLGIDNEALTHSQATILWQLRLPRIVTGCVVGGALGVSGVGFQSLFRNPLADPYVIGASSGAALGVTLALVFGFQASVIGWGGTSLAAFFGCIASVAIVFVIGSVGREPSALTLLLAGVALSSMVNAIVSLMMYLNDEKVVAILAWLMGSLAGNDWQVVNTTIVLTTIGLVILWSLSRAIDAFTLGDTASQSLGLDLTRFRILMVTGASIATAAAVAAAGIIGFVGLISPHIARVLVGPRHAVLVPMSGIVGAGILLVSDDLARTIVAPTELPVGIITAILGGPFFLFLLKSKSNLRGMSA